MVVAEDTALLRQGLVRLLRGAGLDVVGEAADAEALLRLVESRRPDVVVVDVRMPPTHTTEGLRAAAAIRDRWPEVGVMILSHHVEPRYALDLLARGQGRVGYLLKDRVADAGEFAGAVRRVADGSAVVDPDLVARLVDRRRATSALDRLTAREREILGLMAQGRSNAGIRTVLVLSPKTVETHVSRIFAKLGLEPAEDDHRRVLAILAYLRS